MRTQYPIAAMKIPNALVSLKPQVVAVIGILSTAISVAAAAQAAYPIAGLTPDQRPLNAPVISQIMRDESWFQHALTGITQPYPESLRFLKDQGNWYTPFNQRGMTGRYDIRGWHEPKTQ